MGLFSKQKQPSATFDLPADLRSDIRQVFDKAPADACGGHLRPAELLPGIVLLNERLPADETVLTLTRCREYTIGDGYMVLTSNRLIFVLQPVPGAAGLRDGPPQVVALPLADITKFVFDAGMAGFNSPGYPGGVFNVALPWGGPYSQSVCEQVDAGVARQGKLGL